MWSTNDGYKDFLLTTKLKDLILEIIYSNEFNYWLMGENTTTKPSLDVLETRWFVKITK
jgi:hypothetical protein